MKIKKMHFMLLAALMLVLAACGGTKDDSTEKDEPKGEETAGEYEDFTIMFSHNQPVESPEHAGAAKFKEIVEEKSGGKITVDLFPASQLGGLREQVESTQIGEINITMQPSAVVTPFVDDIKITDLPYLLPSDTEQMYKALDSEVGTEILDTLEAGGFKGLGFWPGGYKLMTTKDTEIKSPADMKGLTMRVMESPLLIEQYKLWGANAVPLGYAEVYNALQQGVVDGQENPLQTIFLNNYQEVQGNVIESYHGAMTYVLLANQSWFEGLPEEAQTIILEAEEEGKTAARTSLAETEADYKQKIIDSGVTYTELTDEEIEVFREISEPFHEEAYNKPNQIELLKKFKEEIEKNK